MQKGEKRKFCQSFILSTLKPFVFRMSQPRWAPAVFLPPTRIVPLYLDSKKSFIPVWQNAQM